MSSESNLSLGHSAPDTQRYYFGCWDTSIGHHLHDDKGNRPPVSEWPSRKLDGGFTPAGELDAETDRRLRKHGAAKLWHTAGWTILALHDYSRDARGGSNAAFIFRGLWTTEDLLAEARRIPSFARQLEHIEARGPIRVIDKHTVEALR